MARTRKRARRLWSWLKAHAWPVRLVLAFAAAALGLWGLSRQADPAPWPERLYSVIQLFVLEAGDIKASDPGGLHVARFLAAGVATSALWGALALLFSEHFTRLRIRWLMKDHVVVCGLGRNGLLISEGFCERGDGVVAVDLVRSAGIDGSRGEAIVLVGDARDRRVLERAGVAKARLLVVTCGGDGTNAEVAIAAREVIPAGRRRPLTCLVHIADPDLSALLTESEISNAIPRPFRLEFVDPVSRGVAELMRQDDPLVHTAEKGPHVLVVGLGRVGRSVAVHAGQAWRVVHRTDAKGLRITIVDLDADAGVADLAARYPALARGCDLVPWSVDVTAVEFQDGRSMYERNLDWPFSRVYVCLGEDARSLGAALVARRRLPDRRVPIFARATHHRGLANLLDGVAGGPYEDIAAFSPNERMCRPEALLWGPTEILARAIHEDYVQSRRLDHSPTGRRSLVEWESLPDRLRESNRRLAREMGEKLRSVGCRLQPITDWDAEPATFSEDEIERLAEMEHAAWRREREGAGWTNDEIKDVNLKRSPYLVPWDQLSAPVQDIDRGLVRDLPAFLARVGFAVVRTTAVGVTGHRVLTDPDALRLGVDEALGRIEATHPGRPLTILSALAEGADRLVAQRVLARPGSRLVAVLPLPRADYLRDFADEPSREEFRRLLIQAERVIELPSAPTRDEAYERAGQYVLGHCEVLVALWDGADAQGPGGTADVVALARQRRAPLAWVHTGTRPAPAGEPAAVGDDQGRVTFENL